MREALHHLAGDQAQIGPDLPSPGREEKQEFMDKSSISNLNWNCLVCCHVGKEVLTVQLLWRQRRGLLSPGV